MTPEQRQELKTIGQRLKTKFQDFHGSIKFNMNPNAKETNVNLIDDSEKDVEVQQNHKL